MVSMNGQTEIDMKVNGSTAWGMARVVTLSPMEMFTLASITMAKPTGTVNTSGRTVTLTRVFSLKEWKKAKVSGRNQLSMNKLTCMRVNITRTWSMAKASLDGRLADSTVVATWTILRRDTARCTGLMAAFIEVNGIEESKTGSELWSSQMAQEKPVFSRRMYLSNFWLSKQPSISTIKRQVDSQKHSSRN